MRSNGGCSTHASCLNTLGSRICQCGVGYPYGNGEICSLCPENKYFKDMECLSCPNDSTSSLTSTSITDCKCTDSKKYPDDETLTCLPCPLGLSLDLNSNTCQSNFFIIQFFFFFFIYFFFKKMERKINQ